MAEVHRRHATGDERDLRAAWREVSRLATRQGGQVSTAQLTSVGVDRARRHRAVRDQRLFPHGPGVFLVGHRHLGEDARLMTALLRGGPGAMLAGRPSLVFRGLLADERRAVEVLVPRTQRPKPGIVLRRVAVDERDVRERRGIRALAPLPALVDAAGQVSPGQLAAAVNEAAVRRMLHPHAEAELLARSRRRRGALALRAALADLDPSRGRPNGALERRWAAFTRAHGLPRYVRGGLLDLGDAIEVELTEMDVWFPDAGLLVELDSLAFHEAGTRPVRDRRRDRRLLAAGIPTLRPTWIDFDHHEAELLEDVLAALAIAPALRKAAVTYRRAR